jgi:hypothetical protein
MKSQTDNAAVSLNRKQYYKELGSLLYSVASFDHKVRSKERRAMYDLVLKELATAEHTYDSSGMNQAFYTQFEFEELEKQNTSPIIAYESFMKFYHSNRDAITVPMKATSLSAIEKVASAFRGINKQEQEIISSVQRELTS